MVRLVCLMLTGCGVTSATIVVRPDGGIEDTGTAEDGGDITDAGTEDQGMPDLDGAMPGPWPPALTWQIQLTGSPDTSFDVDVYVLDLFDTPSSLITSLRAEGRRVVCWVSAGTLEAWRPDVGAFPAGSVGADVVGYPDERWLDHRQPAVRNAVEARLDEAASKRCDGVQVSSVDAYLSSTGFPLTAQDQLDYNLFLANAAHARGLTVALTNDVPQVTSLVAAFDLMVLIECVETATCEAAMPFLDAGKAVLHAEPSEVSRSAVCAESARLGYSTIIKPNDFSAPRTACL